MRISDWSSDVCSSDLSGAKESGVSPNVMAPFTGTTPLLLFGVMRIPITPRPYGLPRWTRTNRTGAFRLEISRLADALSSSEERRVGKELGSTCRYQRAANN